MMLNIPCGMLNFFFFFFFGILHETKKRNCNFYMQELVYIYYMKIKHLYTKLTRWRHCDITPWGCLEVIQYSGFQTKTEEL